MAGTSRRTERRDLIVSDAISEGYDGTNEYEYWVGVGEVAHQGAPTVAELEAQGWVKVCQSWRYGTWLMARMVTA